MINYLFRYTDNSALIFFRMIFGLLIVLESFGAIATGWVKRVFVDTQFNFNFIGFEFLNVLHGPMMYGYYAVMGVFALGVMLGYRYRWSAFFFTLMWAGVYFAQKSSYNNHYYLLVWLGAIMTILPAHKFHSLDVKRGAVEPMIKMPQWVAVVMMFQMGIVYFYGGIAKIYPDWLEAIPMSIFTKSKADYPIIGFILESPIMHYFLSYAGLIFDLTIVFFLLWKPTRKFAFFATIFFHIFNAIVFQVGIFPFMSLAFCLFFFNTKVVHRWFMKRKEYYAKSEMGEKKYLLLTALIVYMLVHLALPLRHWFIPQNVLWTEEGHRLSWRMMLRAKWGRITFIIKDKETGERLPLNHRDYLSPKQQRIVATKPDVIWQFVQFIKEDVYPDRDLEIKVKSRLSVNGRKLQPFINPEVDLAQINWDPLLHSEWILPNEELK